MATTAWTIGAATSAAASAAAGPELDKGAIVQHTPLDGKEVAEEDEKPLKGHYDGTAETAPISMTDMVGLVLHFEPSGAKLYLDPKYCAGIIAIFLELSGYWIYVAAYVLAELGCWAFVGESFFGLLNGGAVESMRLAKLQSQGLSMQLHVLGGSGLWFLGATQVLAKRWRSEAAGLAWLHRTLGRLFLLLWLFVAGPTAAHLSLFVGVGHNRMHGLMTAFTVTGLDTTLLAYYYFWRAWQIARHRARKSESLKLHGLAMRVGLIFTLLITYQRSFQLAVLALRHANLLLASWLDINIIHAYVDFLNRTVLDHHAVLSWTTLFPGGLCPLLLDGPRSRVMVWFLGLKSHEDKLEFFGSLSPGSLEVFLWRARLPLYLALRALVTLGWTRDPADTWPGPGLGLNSDLTAGW